MNFVEPFLPKSAYCNRLLYPFYESPLESYLQEHVFTTLATSVILIGAFIGLLLDLEEYKRYCFAGLAGIFLYTSLCSIFPVINDTLNECRQATQEMQDLSEEDAQNLKNKVLFGLDF